MEQDFWQSNEILKPNQLHFSLLFSDRLMFNRLRDSHNVPCTHISQNDSLGRLGDSDS